MLSIPTPATGSRGRTMQRGYEYNQPMIAVTVDAQ